MFQPSRNRWLVANHDRVTPEFIEAARKLDGVRCVMRGRAPFKPGKVRHPPVVSDLSRQMMVWYDPPSLRCQSVRLLG